MSALLTEEFLWRTLPFVSLGLVLLGFALIEMFRVRVRGGGDLMTLTIGFSGVAGAVYLGSLALNYSPLGIEFWPWWFDAVRGSLLLTLIGLPSIWRNVWLAWQEWREKGR